MRPTPFQNPITTASTTRGLPLGILTVWLVIASIAGASPPKISESAQPLPLDHSIHGYATPGEPAFYEVEVTEPSLMVVEAHANGSSTGAHDVRFVDRDGQSPAVDLQLPAIRGRAVRRIVEPGTYYVEVIASRPGGEGFRLHAWTVDRHADPTSREPMDETDEVWDGPPTREPMDETDEICSQPPTREPMDETDEICSQPPTREPMDETDEICNQPPTREPMDETDEICSQPPTREPMDETDEITGPATSWWELPGYGLLELPPDGGQIRRHSWCSWTQRPELLSTFTCARQLRIDDTRTITIHPISPAGFEMIDLVLPAAGQVTFEASGGLEPTIAIFDASGQLLAEPDGGEPVWLEAGHAFLRAETGTGREAVVLDVEVD